MAVGDVEIVCPKCLKSAQLPLDLIDKHVKCPDCDHTFLAEAAVVGADPDARKRFDVFKAFFYTLRPVITQFIDAGMARYEEAAVERDEERRKWEADLAARENQLAAHSSLLSDREDAVINRELALQAREEAIVARERQLAGELAKMEAIKTGLASLLNGRSGG